MFLCMRIAHEHKQPFHFEKIFGFDTNGLHPASLLITGIFYGRTSCYALV